MPIIKINPEVRKTDDEGSHRPHTEESHQEEAHDESNWLVSYADMMTLLCGFFIMMFALSNMNKKTQESTKKNVSEHFGGQYVSPTRDLAVKTTKVLEDLGIEKEVEVETDPTGVSLIFKSTVFFDTLSARVKPSGGRIISRLIDSISEREKAEGKKYKIMVEGHTDQRPISRGPFPSNWELSGARASGVVRMFLDRGFSKDQLVAIGYADTRPSVKKVRMPSGQMNQDALAKNRRVVLRIIEPGVKSIPWDFSVDGSGSVEVGPSLPPKKN